MVTLYHRTTEDAARKIVSDGFRDGEGYYMTEKLHTGVWLSDRPLDANEGAWGNTLLRVELTIDEQELRNLSGSKTSNPIVSGSSLPV
jgi:hypothetical protein